MRSSAARTTTRSPQHYVPNNTLSFIPPFHAIYWHNSLYDCLGFGTGWEVAQAHEWFWVAVNDGCITVGIELLDNSVRGRCPRLLVHL